MMKKYLIFIISKLIILWKQKTKRIILVFRYDELGDWILWLSAAAELRKFYPKDNYWIVLVGKPGLTQLNKECPYWDEVWDFELKQYLTSFFYRMKIIFKLMGACIVLNPVLSRTLTIDQLIGYSLARDRIGIDIKSDQVIYCPEEERHHGNSFYTKLISIDLNKTMLEINAHFVHAVTGKKFQPGFDSLEFIPDVIPKIEHYITVVPGAGSVKRCWEPQKFAEIINRIIKGNPNLKIVLSGMICDVERAEKIISMIDTKDAIIDYCGQTDLVELCGLIKKSNFVLGNDTAAIHLAASYKVTSVCILGGGHFGMFHPYNDDLIEITKSIAVYSHKDCYNCNWHCYQNPYSLSPYPCISAVSVDSVWQKVNKLLNIQ